jgi:hypothetical protein
MTSKTLLLTKIELNELSIVKLKQVSPCLSPSLGCGFGCVPSPPEGGRVSERRARDGKEAPPTRISST